MSTDDLRPGYVPRFRPLSALDRLVGHFVVVLEVLLIGLYVLVAHEDLRASVLRYAEPVALVRAVSIYPSSRQE